MSDASALSGGVVHRIRPFLVSDLDSALKIEADCFPHPWSKEMFLAELGRDKITRCFIAEVTPGGRGADRKRAGKEMNLVAGYIMSWLVADELHITNLAVSPAHRRSGLAAGLVEHALEDARDNGASWCQLEVRFSNRPAQALYRKFGFRKIGIRREYYHDGEDAVVMGLDL
jgi:ribosomal-protein-alanine N-acetyltransferase